MVETDGYDTPGLTQELCLNNRSQLMDVEQEINPETTNPDLGPDQNPPGADQDDEKAQYDCRSQSTEEIEECRVGTGTPLPETPVKETKELVWGLSKDECATVMVEGINHP